MLDIEFIRKNRETVIRATKNKNLDVDIDRLIKLSLIRARLKRDIEEKRAAQHQIDKQIQAAGKPDRALIEQARKLKAEISQQKSKLEAIDPEYDSLLKSVPNIPTDDTPIGRSEDDNQVVEYWGEKRQFDFKPKNHWQLAQQRGWIDKERAAKVTGTRFAYILGDLAKLQMAIINFVFDRLTDQDALGAIVKEFDLDKDTSTKPFLPVLPPLMLKTEVFEAMDRLEPSDDRYKIEGDNLWLQGSAEHVLGPMHQGEIIDRDRLPLRYLGYATSFRREAGTYGKDMEGIIRMHQFDKLEMEIIAAPENGLSEHLFTIAVQEHLLRQLQLPYRKLLKCTADIGKPNARGVDLETWLPGQGRYRETHTADFMTDYQARRLMMRTRRQTGSETEYTHTIDATAFALGRTMVAIIENYQTDNGRVVIPDVLISYMGGVKEI